MALKYNYALILAVNAADDKALTAAMDKPGIVGKLFRTTISQVNVDPQESPVDGMQVTDISRVSFAEVTDSVMRTKSSALKFVSLSFKESTTIDDVKKAIENKSLDGILKNSQHYSVFQIATPN